MVVKDEDDVMVNVDCDDSDGLDNNEDDRWILGTA